MRFDLLAFLKELPKSYGQIGAMLPSSPCLGRAMIEPIKKAEHPLSILEVGPGTGPFTKQIFELMGPEDKFFICEINPRFMERLKEKFASNPDYLRNKDRIVFYQGPVQELAERYPFHKFDMIVSSLPFSNFSPEMVDELLGLYRGMLAPHGVLSFCEYWGVRKLSTFFSTPSRRERLKGVDQVISDWTSRTEQEGEVITKLSVLNFPPAMAIQFCY